MIPIPGLDSVRCAWVEISKEGFTLHGFFIFLGSDHFFPEYIDGDGLADLDTWTGDECAVFVIQSPSAKWIEYTKANNHTWWKLFGQFFEFDDYMKQVLAEHGNIPLVQMNGSKKTLRDIFAPCLNQFQHSAEIGKILHRFNLNPTDHPCLILFKDLKDSKVWYVDMTDLVDTPERVLRQALHDWFAGREFQNLLKEASNA